ncbi:phage antirepressor N-terminal domain-containing protein [Desulfobacterales bacterium HSG2]|nr:phage antirepressor N-terminal domain-containing protein [Desulfobacterales bacterium HSG2]
MIETETATVDFHGNTLVTIRHNGVEYVAMKSVVEGMGLNWRAQQAKIRSSKRYGDIAIPLATSGGIQEMLCIPLAKLNGWLFSVSPEKVRPELRDTVVMYQDECFAVLYDYWHKGSAVNPRHEHRQTTVALLASEAESAKRLAGTLEIGDTRVVSFINAVIREIYDTDCLRLAEQAGPTEIRLAEQTANASG